MSKNKNNKPIWGTRIKKNASTLFKKVGGSLPVDKRLFKEDIEGSIAHVEMLHKQKIINFRICLLYTSPSPRDRSLSRMPSSA